MPIDPPPSQIPPHAALAQLIHGRVIPPAIAVVAKLRVADLLADGPMPVADLAAKTNTHAPSLYRILRLLAAVDVFAEQADGRFALTPMGKYLRTGVEGSLRGLADFVGSSWSWRVSDHLLETAQTGRNSFEIAWGEPIFDYLSKHPETLAVFNEAMTGFSSTIAPAVAEAYDFAVFKTVVDVGGGHGALLSTILQAHAGVNGVVFDSPHVAVGAEDALRKAGLAERCRAVGGDFFQSVPGGGDAYLLRGVVHDWSDSQAATILRNCRQAVNPGGKLLLIEVVLMPGNAAVFGKLLDLQMLMNTGGRERTEDEYRQLLAAAGWRLTRMIPTQSVMKIVEAEPA